MVRFFLGAGLAVLLLVGVIGGLAGWERLTRNTRLLNVSYDPTRELWAELHAAFAERAGGVDLRTSHGGSTSQARAVLDGLAADVVSLAMWADVDALRQASLIAPGWEQRYPPAYLSTVVFVVRRGNPHAIHDWPDLLADDVAVITPSPKTSGNGRMSFLAAWGAARLVPGGSDEATRTFVRRLYARVPVLDTTARASALTFAQKGLGDVLLTWENEAHLLVREFPAALAIVYPSRSIRAEPPVAIVDRVVDRKGTRPLATAYLDFLYSESGQEILARHHYRPTNAAIWKRHAERFGSLPLFAITEIVPGGWAEAQERFFVAGGEYDRLGK